jgi:glycosyltransferase involved in cell wall biosynthesis
MGDAETTREPSDKGSRRKEQFMTLATNSRVGDQPLQPLELSQDHPGTDAGANKGSELPLISVVIPAHNAEKFISCTLGSVLSQTYKNIEVLVVNDGSTDGTVMMVESFLRSDSRLKILHQPKQGAPAARNYGIRSSKGEYIAFIDADDIWHKEKLQAQIECFRCSDPSVGLVYSWSIIIDEMGNPLSGIAHDYWGNVLAELIYANFVGNGSCPLIRRTCFDEVGNFKVHLGAAQDWDMYLRIAERYEFRVTPKFYVGYRRASNGISADYKNQERFIAMVIGSFEDKHPSIPKALFRLSRSRTCFYLASRCNDQGRYLDSIKYFIRCLVLDPVRLLSSEYHLSVLKLLIRCTTKPVVSLIRGSQPTWKELHRRVSTLAGLGPVGQFRMGDGELLHARPRLYDRVHNWRMARLKHRVVAGGS